MHTFQYILPLLVLSTASAAPSRLDSRQVGSSTCEKFNPVKAGPFNVANNVWGPLVPAPGDGQGQCVQIDSLNGESLAWRTTFSWTGSSIQSYAYALSSDTPCKPLNQYSGVPTTWAWNYNTTQILGDVAYDIFLHPSCIGPGELHAYEIMIWVAAFGGLHPIGWTGETGSAIAKPTIGGTAYSLYKGTNTETGTTVLSFVAASQINDFSGDLMDFMDYLVDNAGVDPALYMTSIQAGTEVANGKNAEFVTSKYTISSSFG